jgi:hypothetical protein
MACECVVARKRGAALLDTLTHGVLEADVERRGKHAVQGQQRWLVETVTDRGLLGVYVFVFVDRDCVTIHEHHFIKVNSTQVHFFKPPDFTKTSATDTEIFHCTQFRC